MPTKLSEYGGNAKLNNITSNFEADVVITPDAGESIRLDGDTVCLGQLRLQAFPVQLPIFHIVDLPDAATYVGCRAMIDDGTIGAWGDTVGSGGGSTVIPVWSDGTNWRNG